MHEYFMAVISCTTSESATNTRNSLSLSINALTCSPRVFGGVVAEGSEGVRAAVADRGSWSTPPSSSPQDAGVWALS